jgi:hypothetical protein
MPLAKPTIRERLQFGAGLLLAWACLGLCVYGVLSAIRGVGLS